MNKIVVSFLGRAGSGKDYQCNLLVRQGFKKISFADALRDISFKSLLIDPKVGIEQYEYLKQNPCIEIRLKDRTYNLNFRQYLEHLSTQGIRHYNSNFWCECLCKTILENNYQKICIADLRFVNEYQYLEKFCQDNNYNFKCIFCNYRSQRYQENNNHESALLANWLVEQKYKDLQEVTKEDIDKFADIQSNLYKVPIQ